MCESGLLHLMIVDSDYFYVNSDWKLILHIVFQGEKGPIGPQGAKGEHVGY